MCFHLSSNSLLHNFANFCSLCLGLRTLGNLTRPLKGTCQFQKAPHLEVLLFLFFLSHKKKFRENVWALVQVQVFKCFEKVFFVCPPFATRASIGLTEPRAIYSFSLEIENENTFIYNFFFFLLYYFFHHPSEWPRAKIQKPVTLFQKTLVMAAIFTTFFYLLRYIKCTNFRARIIYFLNHLKIGIIFHLPRLYHREYYRCNIRNKITFTTTLEQWRKTKKRNWWIICIQTVF